MKPVRLLEARVIDQIAAGEVVERPASVVKELVENALDAGARAIDILLKDGGRTLVRVADDGDGMEREDAMLAIERHATSKLRDVDDLQGIGTLGFRGEALPSIASVCRFELVTRTETGEGTRIRVDAGTLQDVRPVGAAKGTAIDVRNLFHTLPARRAFLRSSATELSHCTETVIRLALARPDVAFTLRHEDRMILRSPASEELRLRATDLLGPDASKLVPVEVGVEGGLRLVGLAATAGLHRASVGTALYLYVDGRWVRDAVLRRAVQHAYRDLVPEGRHPLVVLDLRVPAGAADVNVHPTKAEVRFRDPSGVAAFVGERLRELVRSDPRRAGQRPPEAAPAALPFVSRVSALPPEGLLSQPDPTAVAPAYVPPGTPAYVATVAGPVAVPTPVAVPPMSGAPMSGAPMSAVPPEALLAREPPSDTRPRLLTVVRDRWFVLEDPGGIVVIDGGRLARRVAARGPLGAPRRLMVPQRVTVTAEQMAALEAAEEGLARLGLGFVRFSATEVAVRSVPDALSDADPAELLRIAAVAAVAAEPDVRDAWAERLGPAALSADLLARAAALGLPFGPVVGRVPLSP